MLNYNVRNFRKDPKVRFQMHASGSNDWGRNENSETPAPVETKFDENVVCIEG